jgi:hypothetical protein
MRKMNITSANLILKIIVGLGNGHEIVASAYHTMAYLKIGHMMDKINELVMDRSDRGQWAKRWDYLNMGLLKSIKEGMQKELTKAAMGLIELHMKPNDTRKLYMLKCYCTNANIREYCTPTFVKFTMKYYTDVE